MSVSVQFWRALLRAGTWLVFLAEAKIAAHELEQWRRGLVP